ncbi:MAG: hemolysin family protein [Candidatus Nanoarchaeia archaeon]|jgi:CBS domain containing-hemolysin-like protein
MIGYIMLLVALIVLSAFFSASEIAIFSTSTAKVRSLLEKGVRGSKKLDYLKSNPKKTLSTILIGNNIVNISASSIATMLAIRVFGDLGTGLATGAMVLLILVFGEISPKAYATHHAEPVALFAAPILLFLMKALYPIVIIFEFTARKLTGTESGMKPQAVTEEELKATLEMSAASGNVKKEEKEMIESVLRFNDITVREVMTHRSEMVCIDESMKIKDAAEIMEAEGFSRYPVNKKSKENIVGAVHIKDVFFAATKGNGNKPMKSVTTKIEFVPQHMLLNQLFKEFQDKQMHMAIVANDHGEVIGLVTLEDLLEELVGEIIDETDVRQHLIKRLDKQTVLAHGTTELRSLNRFFHTTLPGSLNDSLSKIILKNIKKFPKQDEVININQNEITIVEATPKKIVKVKIKKMYE